MAMVVAGLVIVVTANAIKPTSVRDHGLTGKEGQDCDDDRDREKQKASGVVHDSLSDDVAFGCRSVVLAAGRDNATLTPQRFRLARYDLTSDESPRNRYPNGMPPTRSPRVLLKPSIERAPSSSRPERTEPLFCDLLVRVSVRELLERALIPHDGVVHSTERVVLTRAAKGVGSGRPDE